ncbi:hypothetical protein Tfer_0902 [Thermincola ferriacetica]|uniref:Replication initiator A N-terminal domain-containing protein n=1 Tax=Thermincola ferriacetica TaxID=281456 RepID=A0A0L6W435_9FIRM|nr:replication initiator protein A [Thermincola ferriacetica]KNZ70342.1 hypothetical protein Tfer_0902 [Thermincola ferriacetica]
MGDLTQDKPQPDRLMINEVDPRKRYSVEDIANARYFQLPKFLFEGEFTNLSNDARVLYALLRDRHELSIENGWVNKKGEVYLIYSRSEMAEILKCSQPTLRKVLQELKEARLIEEERVGLNRPNQIYLLQKTFEALEPQGVKNFFTPECKNFLPGVKKNFIQECKKVSPNETEYNETEFNETEINNIYYSQQQQSNNKYNIYSQEKTSSEQNNVVVVDPLPGEQSDKVKEIRDFCRQESLDLFVLLTEDAGYMAELLRMSGGDTGVIKDALLASWQYYQKNDVPNLKGLVRQAVADRRKPSPAVKQRKGRQKDKFKMLYV